ncbi:EXO1 [Candida margitis]|uniref:EXO1 n=1 Tax=Candida margitis TaxID=1775924 RepID=UPI00222694FF|nr:EXO1 [Candida margitis]KAI5967973.1 EXO1 [Candida margitis]
MGVNGLLQHLKEIQDPCSLERYRGKTLAIDTYGWLHRALVSCAEDLCLGRPTRKYITYIINKIQMLQHFGITPFFVFDGASLTTKQETNMKRRESRSEAKALAEKYAKSGHLQLAYKEYMKAAYVTSQMAKSIMCELDVLKIRYVVAPYEADPQMVYLEKIGVVDGILSEDSDLLIFGCNKLITKLKDDSSCVEINRADFDKVRQIPYLASYTNEQLRLVAMLSGCDYTKGIPGVGLKSAFQMVLRYRTLHKVTIALRSTGKKIPPNFEEEVVKANLAFQFQKVFDPRNQTLTTLNEVPESLSGKTELLESCCGRTLADELVKKACNGLVDPNSHELLVSREQSMSLLKSVSVKVNTTNTEAQAVRSQSEPVVQCQKRTVLDMLKVSKRVAKPSELICDPTQKDTTQVNQQKVSPVFKRPLAVCAAPKQKISPTCNKIRKLQGSINGYGKSGQTSKFFAVQSTPEKQPSLPTPKSDCDVSAWNSSLLNDSEVPDESPIKISETKNILDELTDEDDHTNEDNDGEASHEGEEMAIKMEPIVDSLNLQVPTQKDIELLLDEKDDEDAKFDISSKDDEIEESPIKNRASFKVHTDLDTVNLRSKFQFSPAKLAKYAVTDKNPPSLNNSFNVKHSRQALSDKSTNIKHQNRSKGILNDKSRINKPKPYLPGKFVKFNIPSEPYTKTQVVSSQEEEYELSEEEVEFKKSPQKRAPIINLKQFAFRK